METICGCDVMILFFRHALDPDLVFDYIVFDK